MSFASAAFLPELDSAYFHYARKAFTMAQFLTNELQLDDSVFNSAMLYWHSFTRVHRLNAVHDALLSAACVFLAAKVAHYKFRAVRLVRLAFDIDERKGSEGGEQEGSDESLWRAALLDVELLLCDSLEFRFHVVNPTLEMERVLENAAASESISQADMPFVAQLIARVKRIYLLMLITPLQNRVPADALCSALLYLVLHRIHTTTNPLNISQQRYCQRVIEGITVPPPEIVNGILNVIIETFTRLNKSTDVPGIDQLMVERRRQAQRQA